MSLKKWLPKKTSPSFFGLDRSGTYRTLKMEKRTFFYRLKKAIQGFINEWKS